ncbi:hypothetical protein Fcan01_22783 [Folsomia candida]|uniref:Uncharacterized protein n=1 Tax=Folsomia candida TaxID=158441 RepID=A0A226DAH9_FOLCA|nr:hypothetical protein Fcan01_22783 [Folsomia candida]
MYQKLIFCTIFALSSFAAATNLALLAPFQIQRLLENITHCDVQILHDGIDIGSFDNPVKVIYIHKYLNRCSNIFEYCPSAINAISSRSPECKLSFLLSNIYVRAFFNIRPASPPLFILMSLSSHYHVYYMDYGKDERFYYLENKMFFVILTRKPGKLNHFESLVLPLRKQTFVVILSYITENLIHKVCGIPYSVDDVVRRFEDCEEIIDWHQRTSYVTSWKSEWHYKLPYLFERSSTDLISPNSNPFDHTKDYTIQHFAEISFSKANMTVTQSVHGQDSGPLLQFNYDFSPTVLNGNMEIMTYTLITTSSPGLQFLSCYRERYQPYQIYISPFQRDLWLALFVTLTLNVVLASIYKHFSVYTNISFSTWLFILATMFEEAGHVPSKIERNTHFRLTLGIWCLMSVILTNCYNGLMISELNAPLPAFEPGTFRDLLCRKLSRIIDYSIVNDIKYLDAEGKFIHELTGLYFSSIMKGNFTTKNNRYVGHNCFKLLSMPISASEMGVPRLPEFVNFLINSNPLAQNNRVENSYLIEQAKLFTSLLLPIHSHHPNNFTYSADPKNFTEFKKDIERDLVPCGKTVFIAYPDVLEGEYAFLSKHYPWHKFYKGKQILPSNWYATVFRHVGISKIPIYNKYLVESGVFGRLWYEMYIRLDFGRKPATDESARRFKQPKESVNSLGLGGAIQTFFIVWATTVVLTLPAFGFEVRHRIVQWLWVMALSIYITTLKIWRSKCFQKIKSIPRLGSQIGTK